MSARLRIQHQTGYTYDQPVTSSYNQVRVTPMTTPEQIALRTRVDVRPSPWSHVYHDYWGSQVTAFEVHEPHDALSVTATSTVEVDRPHAEPPGGSWELVRSAEVADAQVEYLSDDAVTRPPSDLADRARALAAEGTWPDDVALAVCGLLHEQVRYVPGSTTVASRAADAWTARSGVCQDLAHLALGALRSVGIPARYVSGYLHPDPEAPVGVTVSGESHAWVEWWSGDWYGWDPTNDLAPGDRHVVVARGRGYDDVPPLRGIYAGRARSSMVVKVDITRVA